MIIISLLVNLLFSSQPATVQAAPSVEEIQTLPPSEVIMARPFVTSLGEIEVIHNLELDSRDIIKLFPSPELGIGSQVRIWRAPEYIINDSNHQLTVKSWGYTIDEVLKEAKIQLGPEDTISPPITETVSRGITISITRIAKGSLVVSEDIPYKTETKEDNTLEKGKQKVITEGERGRKDIEYLVITKNGFEESRTLIKETVVKTPVSRVIAIGTKETVLSSVSGKSSWTYTKTAMRNYSRGTSIRVTNLANGKSVTTTVGDYGPSTGTGRILDLNIDAWEQIASSSEGVISVKVEEIKS